MNIRHLSIIYKDLNNKQQSLNKKNNRLILLRSFFPLETMISPKRRVHISYNSLVC